MESIKELRKICQPKAYQYHVSERFYKIFSIYITKIFIILGLRPNSITVLGFLTGIAGGFLYLAQSFFWGSIFFLVFYMLDNVDGEVARYRKLSSMFGVWLDAVAGHLIYPCFFLALGLGVFFKTGIFWHFFLGVVAATAKLVERSVPNVLTGGNENQEKLNSSRFGLKDWLGRIGKFSILFPLVIFCSSLGWETWFLWFFAVYLSLFALGKIFLTGRRTHGYNH